MAIDPALQLLFDRQHDQAMESIEIQKNIAHEADQTARLQMLTQMKGDDIRDSAFDEYTKAGDFLLRQQGAVMIEDEKRMGLPEAAVPQPWAPASEVIRNAADIGGDVSIDPARAAINYAERLQGILQTLDANGGNVDALGTEDKAWLESHGVGLDYNEIQDAADRAQREADAISRVLKDQVTDADVAAFLDWLKDISDEFHGDADELVEAWEFYNDMREVKHMVDYVLDNLEGSSDSFRTHLEEYFSEAGSNAADLLEEHGIDTGHWSSIESGVNALYEQAEEAAFAELNEFAENRGSAWGTWTTGGGAVSQSIAIASAQQALLEDEEGEEEQAASDILTEIS